MEYDPDEALRLENQLCFPLYAAARRVTGMYTPHLKALGLTYTQYVVMLVLWERDGLSVSEIGQRLLLDSGTLTPLLKKLESKGYISRKRSAEDGRSLVLGLTPEGAALKDDALPIPAQIGTCLGLSGDEAKTLYSLIGTILTHLLKEKQHGIY